MNLKPITSRDNAQYKELKQLATSAQARKRAGQALLEGIHLCEAYLQQGGEPPLMVVSEASMANGEVAELLSTWQKKLPHGIILPESLYNAVSQVENGIGILFVIPVPRPVLPARLAHSAVLLDRLQDPGNLGSILRSAAAAGIPAVYCSPETVSAWSPKVLRAGMGAHFLLQVHENVDLAALLAAAAVPVLATSSHVSETIYQADLRGPAAWLFGHEGQGVSPALLAHASRTLTIPQRGAIESMNVAASAAVCFFEQVRQQSLA